jgi:glycine cleavage system H protein
MADRKYAKTHEWVSVDGDVATIGISQYAVDELGEVVPFDLPKVGAQVSAGSAMGEIESVKAVSELYAPVSGDIIEVNESLESQPELVNSSPLDEGWICKVRLSDTSELAALMDEAIYNQFLSENG